MNQEEFDNKLGDSFKNEHLPPDKRLWENISARLDEGKKKPFPFWLIPVFVAVLAVGAWLMGTVGNKVKSTRSTSAQIESSKLAKAIDTDKQIPNAIGNATTTETAEANNEGGNTTPTNAISTAYSEPNTLTNNGTNAAESRSTKTKRANNSNTTIANNATNTSNASNTGNTNGGNQKTPTTDYDFNDVLFGKQKLTKPVLSVFAAPNEESEIFSSLKLKKGKVIRSRYTKQPVDFDSKWWWSVGAGPQISYNKAIVPDDSISKIHKDLWANRNLLTHNGTGFHSQFLLGHRLGKHFSMETGLQYGRHAEDIKFNVTSFAVETRDKYNTITAYEDSVLFWIVLSSHPYDTTYYYATRGFSLVSKNRYQIFTIPLRFNYEQNISPNTKIVAGIGAGFSGIRSTSVKHLTLINDTYFVEKKSTQFTASFSAQLGLYTNINEIGQLGFYTNLQMYAKPWEMGNKQYSIRMSDLQFGLSFRRPLNWR